ncbi:MAG: aldehyde dehydrogenase family protein [Amphritea sp.]
MKTYNKLYIDGQWATPNGSASIDVINPATDQVIGTTPAANASDVDHAVMAARRAFADWSQTSAETRAGYIKAIADKLAERSEEMVQIVTAEMGAPLAFSREVQVEDPIDALLKHADRAAMLDHERVVGNAVAIKEAVGVCVFINPWNYPLHQMIGKVAPALAAGCTMVVKPSEQTPLHAFLLAEVIDEVGLPAGVFNLVNGTGEVVGEPLCTHPEVDMVSFTGSTRAGVRIAQLAAPSVKRVCQELGGKSPFLIAEDANLEAAVQLGVDDVMYNSGQTCTALTRMLVPAERYEEAVEIARQHAESFVVGDPLRAESMIGPMASEAQRQGVLEYIRIGIEEGARLVTGGEERPAGMEVGAYVRPTIFADVNNQMRIAREEIFGPVLCMIPYQDEHEAIAIANDTPYGLSARVWAADTEHARNLARQIRAGQVYVNEGFWNNEAPFGGYKQSGNGRELGDWGVEEFLETKAIIGG